MSNSSNYVNNKSSCGCGGGLGEASAKENKEAKETKKDLINSAKKYINNEIPTKYKVRAGVAVVVLLMIATRGN